MTRLKLPIKRMKSDGTLLTNFTDTVPNACAGTRTRPDAGTWPDDATDNQHFLSGTGACWIKIEDATDTYAQPRFNQAQDWSEVQYITMWVYDNSPESSTNLLTSANISLYASTDAWGTSTNKYKWTASNPGTQSFGGKVTMLTFKIDAPIISNSPTGLDNIVWWYIEVDNRNGLDIEVWIDSMYKDQRARPTVVWMFDDGSAEDYTRAYQFMVTDRLAEGKKPVPGTSFIISDTMAGGGALTLTDAQTMSDSGHWDMGNHTSSTSDLTSLSIADAVASVKECGDYLRANSLPRAADFLAYPGYAANDALRIALAADGVVLGRIGQRGVTQFPQDFTHPDDDTIECFDYLSVPTTIDFNEVNYVAGSNSWSVQQAYALEAAKEGAVIFISGHKIVNTGATGVQTNQASFEELVNWTIQMEEEGLWDMMTLSDWYKSRDGVRLSENSGRISA